MWGVVLYYMPRLSVTEVKAQIDTHEAVCSERWKETILRIKRIEHIIEARREGDIGSLIANTDLAKKLINWKPRYSDLDTIVNSTWEIYKTFITQF